MTAAVSWRSPGRVNLIGEHTDYNDGFCMPLAIQQGCTASVELLEDPVVVVSSRQRPDAVTVTLDELKPGVLPREDEWAGYALGVVWSLAERTSGRAGMPGMRIAVDGDVPAGAGLSSSAALECAVAGAVCDQLALGLEQTELVAVARQAENDFVGAPTGGMDQLASVFGRAGHVLLLDMRSLDVQALPLDLAADGLSLLVVDSKAPHQLTDGLYGDRRASCEAAARLLGVPALRDIGVDVLDDALARLDDDVLRRRARHVITENDRTLAVADLLRTDRTRLIGPLLTASHQSLRDDFEVSVPEVDLAVEVMLASGAHGARITGGGFGGCAIGLFDADGPDDAVRAIQVAYAERDYAPPSAFLATPSDGTHRLAH